MKLHRIYAILLRHMYLFRRSYDKMVDSFYWITLDLLLWGITGMYFQSITPDFQNVIFMILSGVLLWNIVHRGQIDITSGLLEELWNKNLINLFVSPLTFREWIASLVALGFVKAIISFVFGSLITVLLYKFGILFYSVHLLAFMGLLIISGWWIGFLVSSFILRFGTRVQVLAWTFVWLASPFSAVYYPVDILPSCVQVITRIVPMSYVFEEARHLLYEGKIDYGQLGISLVLSIIYSILTFILLHRSFKAVLQKGLVKVY